MSNRARDRGGEVERLRDALGWGAAGGPHETDQNETRPTLDASLPVDIPEEATENAL